MSLFFFDFGSPWALHGMGSYAIRTRRRSPNKLFCFLILSEKSFPKSANWVHFGYHFDWNTDIFVKKEASKNASKKGAPQDANSGLLASPEAPWQPPSRVKVFWTRNNNLNKKQQKLLIIAEVVARSRFLVVFCRIFLQKWLFDLDFLMCFGWSC